MHLRLEWQGGKLFYNNEPLGTISELEAARILLARNLAERTDTFSTYRGEMRCLTAGIGWAADHEVNGDLHFVRTKPRKAATG